MTSWVTSRRAAHRLALVFVISSIPFLKTRLPLEHRRDLSAALRVGGMLLGGSIPRPTNSNFIAPQFGMILRVTLFASDVGQACCYF